MFGAVVRAATGFAFGALVGGVIAEFVGVVRPTIVDGLSESHEIVRYMDAFDEYWILLALLGALLGLIASGVAESSGGAF